MLSSSVSVGFETLRANPLRTILSTLGVIIGVGALVSVLSLADGMEQTARRQLDGTTDVQVLSLTANLTERINGELFPLRDTLRFSRDDWMSVRALPGVSSAALVLSTRTELLVGDSIRRMAAVTETVPDYDAIARVELDAGRYFTDVEVDSGAAVAVVTSSVAKLVVPAGTHQDSIATKAIGREVVLGTRSRRIIGVLDTDQASPIAGAIVPLDFSGRRASAQLQLLLRAERVEDVGSVERSLNQYFAAQGADTARAFRIGSYRARAEQAAQSFLILRLFMGALTGISLLVGGIGIMNVLLASVTERTREIGIRKATGARHRDILMQFLAESVAVTSAGGIIGILLGLTISFGVTRLIQALADAPFIESSVSASTLLIASFASVSIGLIFGTYPARRAARLSPIDAIRHE